jgi:dTDP-4-amino-4,6-dideoxy-D-galactose acyltransferase
MIQELAWDSTLLEKKIGLLEISSAKASSLNAAMKTAATKGFVYVTCKIPGQDIRLTRLLESCGFYLSDIGITWQKDLEQMTVENIGNHAVPDTIRIAGEHDIPKLRKMSRSLFTESRFYHDPFFSRNEADRIYEEWVENSVRGNAADVVFYLPHGGFITCRKRGKHGGEIVLIGLRRSYRHKGYGTALVQKAQQWFTNNHIRKITVRTQVKNIKAMNFYVKSGFIMLNMDLVYGIIL